MLVTEVVGVVKVRPLNLVKPNDWNPNEMDAQMSASLRQGLVEDGWLLSQSLLVWGKDNRGKDRNLIIDGEHRWTEALALGFTEGPMVVLDGLKPAEARALTIKLNQKRGRFNDLLPDVIRSIQRDLPSIDLGLSLGFDPEELYRYLAQPVEKVVGAPVPAANSNETPPTTVSRNVSVTMVPLFLSEAEHTEFQSLVRQFGGTFGTDTASETVLEGMRRANGSPAS